MLEATFDQGEVQYLGWYGTTTPYSALCPEKRLFSAMQQPHWHQAVPGDWRTA